MPFDPSISCQSALFFAGVKADLSEKLIDFSKNHTNIARFTGLPIAVCFSLLDLAQAISGIVEPLIKGIANIFGSPFLEECEFLKGVKQIVVQFPFHLVNNAITWPIATAFDLLITPAYTLISPVGAFESKYEKAAETKKMLDGIANDQPFALPSDPISAVIVGFSMAILKHTYA